MASHSSVLGVGSRVLTCPSGSKVGGRSIRAGQHLYRPRLLARAGGTQNIQRDENNATHTHPSNKVQTAKNSQFSVPTALRLKWLVRRFRILTTNSFLWLESVPSSPINSQSSTAPLDCRPTHQRRFVKRSLSSPYSERVALSVFVVSLYRGLPAFLLVCGRGLFFTPSKRGASTEVRLL